MLYKELEHGVVYIFDEVIKLITKVAITEVEGVECSSSIVKGNILHSLKGNYGSIKVTTESEEVIVDVTVGVIYGNNIPQVINKLQHVIKTHIELFTGFQVQEINVFVNQLLFQD